MKMNSMSSLPVQVKEGVTTSLPVGYRHLVVSTPKMLTIYLHGYADHGGSFTRRLFPEGYPQALAETSALIPNGPFPVPVKTEDGWREAYAWYFFDDSRQKMVISPETAINGILSLVAEFGYEHVPKALVGFSQGGYLAPYLAQRLNNVVTVVGIGTGYRTDFFGPLGKRDSKAPSVHAIHGVGDTVFPLETAKAAHQKVIELGFQGNFHSVENGTHVANKAMGKILSDLLFSEQERLS
jgi:predicted esterase